MDPLGSLIKVTYTAGAMGYSETRKVVPNFVQIRSRPLRPEPKPVPVRPVIQQVQPVQPIVTQSTSNSDGYMLKKQ